MAKLPLGSRHTGGSSCAIVCHPDQASRQYELVVSWPPKKQPPFAVPYAVLCEWRRWAPVVGRALRASIWHPSYGWQSSKSAPLSLKKHTSQNFRHLRPHTAGLIEPSRAPTPWLHDHGCAERIPSTRQPAQIMHVRGPRTGNAPAVSGWHPTVHYTCCPAGSRHHCGAPPAHRRRPPQPLVFLRLCATAPTDILHRSDVLGRAADPSPAAS